MASYFRQVPNFEYVSRNKGEHHISEYIPVKNLFKRGKLRKDIFANLAFFEKYSIIGDERPDQVAFKFYNDSTLDWIVLLANNILNIQSEWPMTQQAFDKVMLDKYGSYENLYSAIHHYETNEIKNSSGITVLQSGIRMNKNWTTNGNFIEVVNSKIANISATTNADGTTDSNIVSVYMINGIPELEVGDQITIINVSEPQYNGQHLVKEILAQSETNVTAFSYELPFVPNVDLPTLADPRQEEVVFTVTEGSDIESNAYYYEYYDSRLGYSVLVSSADVIKEVTNYEYEFELEEKKRNIYVLKPTYLSVVFNDMDDIMPYKKGSTQYVNATLKRGDNIRLYE